MIHAKVSIWRFFIHDIIIEIREKACVHLHRDFFGNFGKGP